MQRQPAPALRALLLALAADHEAVREVLRQRERSETSDRLAAELEKTLGRWRRSTKHRNPHEAQALGREFEAWLDRVARDLAPGSPGAAVALFEAFIEADAQWLEHAEDLDGTIDAAVRTACRHWLDAAARCGGAADAWQTRLVLLVDADDYGVRDDLLRRADRLLDPPALRRLVVRYEQRVAELVAGAGDAARRSPETFRIAAALARLAEVLRDPDVLVRSTRLYSLEPNVLQRQAFVRAYLDAGRPDAALPWLRDPWPTDEAARVRLLADALQRLGPGDEGAPG